MPHPLIINKEFFMTAIPAYGAKHTCLMCVTKFYDMNKTPAACPKCGEHVAAIVRKAPVRRARRPAA